MTQSLASLLRSTLNAASGPRLRRTSQLLPLEQRFMFDGAAAADAAHAAQTPDAAAAAAAPALPPAVTVREAEPAKDNGKKEVVLVDTSLADYKTLEAGVRDGVGIVEFDGSKDGLAQIAQWASTQSGLDAIHILSHGSEGVLNLGSAHLTESSLSDTPTQAELAQLGSALNADGDLMLYGCDTGDSVALLNGLAQATGADVAASTDLTGAAKLGGNWTLEAHAGVIETQALALTQYNSVLDTVSFVYGTDGDDYGRDIDGDGHLYSIVKPVGTTNITFASGGAELYIYYGEGLYSLAADYNEVELTLTVGSGYSFDLNSVKVASSSNALTVTFTYANGMTDSLTPTIPGSGDGAPHVITLSLHNVTSVTFSSPDYTTFQDFVITTAALDTTAPTTTFSGVQLSADTGSSSSDLITKSSAQTISATLSAPLDVGDKVEASVDGGAHWTDVTTKVTGSTLTWTGATLIANDQNLAFRVTDQSGNIGPVTLVPYTLDTTSPSTTVSNLHISADTGNSTDFITSSAAQTITATLSGALAGTDVLYGSKDNGATWRDITSKVSGTSVTWDGDTLANGDSAIKLKVTDNAGNDGTVLSQTYTVDGTPPVAPALPVLSSASDTGESSSDHVTNDTTPTLTGTAESGSTVTIYDGATLLGTTIASGGNWSYTAGALSAGSHSFTATATDTAGNVSAASAALAVTLDTTPPVIASVAVPSDGSYRTGNTLNFTVHTDDPVYVDSTGGTPRLALTIGATTRYATYASGDGTNTLVFSYVVQAGDNDNNGIAIGAFSANGGSVTDGAGNALDAALNNVASTANVLVDTVAPVAISVSVPASATYHTGDTLDFTVYYNEAVTVNTNGGTPRFSIDVGGTTRYASYVSGSGTSALLFRYTVVNGDTDADGINLSGFSFNGGTLSDASGNAGIPTINGIGSTAGVLVDASNPGITGVSASTADGSYGAGQTITLTVDFSTAVDVDTSGGVPTLALDGGGNATYTGGSGTSTLTFSYVVGAGQNSADLDYSGTSALALNGASIVDAGGAHTNAALTLAAPGTAGSLGANKDLVIDTAAPTNTGASVVFSNDTGEPNDLITRVAAQTISGTLAANLATGEYVEVSLDNGGSWTRASSSVGSAWTLTGQTLTGNGTIKVRVSDDADNKGPVYATAYTLDQTVPTVSVTSDVPVLNLNTQAVISFTFSEAPVDFNAGDIAVSGGTLSGLSATANPLVYTAILTPTTGINGGSATVSVVGSYTDIAGNAGAAGAVSPISIDTAAPTTSVASVGFDHDSGASGSDFITNVSAQTVSGTLSANLSAGERVLVSLDNGATWSEASATVGLDSWSLGGQILVSSDTLQVKVSDNAGNDGAVLSQAYVYDTSASVPSVDALQTNSLTPVLTGNATLAAGETMTVTVGGATYDVVPVAGAWSLDLATAVPVSGALTLTPDNQYSVTATVTDLAGNVASDITSNELLVGALPAPPLPPEPTVPGTEGFQTPPVYPEPLSPVTVPVSFLPTAPGVPEQSTPLPSFNFDTGSSGWQSPTLLGDALQPNAELNGGMAELLSPTATAGITLLGSRDGTLVSNVQVDNVAVSSGERIIKEVDAEAFMHNMPGQNVVLSASLVDGRPLPGWLKFNPRDGRFEGTPPPGFNGTLTVRLTARDGLGHEAHQTFEIKVGGAQANQAEPLGRSGLSQQLRDARSAGSSQLAALAAASHRAT